jgi:hypothetical protein
MDYKELTSEALSAAHTEAIEARDAIFALKTPTIEQVDEVETLVASVDAIEAEQSRRADAVKDAETRFANLKAASLTASAEDEDESDDESDDDVADEDESEDESDDSDDADEVADDAVEAATDEDEDEVVTAANKVDPVKTQTITASRAKKTSTAKKVAARNKRPAVPEVKPVVITAAADVPEFSMGSEISDMDKVAKALTNRVKGFPKFNAQAAKRVNKESNGVEVLNKAGVASFGVQFDDTLVASTGKDYSAVRNAFKTDGRFGGNGEVLTAAGWCAPSETVYSFIADYVVDGLITVPEVSAPRGGLLLTTGPARSSQGAALDEFGFVQTETQAEAQEVKTCETIECPDFVDHRLDAIGYCFKIPLLTQKAYPELIADALRFAGVLYAHKVNRRLITDIVGLSDLVTFSGYGPSTTDTLEVLSLIALRERRKWNIGENAVLEVKLPVLAREIFRADMSRRTGLALTDVATDQKIAAEFAARNLSVEYLADWQELGGGSVTLPGTFQAVMYPKGTFIKAVEDVINLSAVYDAASLSINEYTGVFFEQGILVAKAGYASTKVDIPINTAGETGAAILSALGDEHANGSF